MKRTAPFFSNVYATDDGRGVYTFGQYKSRDNACTAAGLLARHDSGKFQCLYRLRVIPKSSSTRGLVREGVSDAPPLSPRSLRSGAVNAASERFSNRC